MEQQGYYINNSYNNGDFGDRKLYSAALYMRFSRDDGQACDSSSITTQKMMLEKYCGDNGYRIYDSYVDDGYTGLNFNRPDFQRMLDDIENGKVNLVITKDLSRLGRDYIQTGYYSEVFFVERQVRYIAVNDGIDTLKADNDIAPFKNILNNLYSKDLSKKVKTAIRQRFMSGMFCRGQAPYGYKKDPNARSTIVIDGEAAGVVREIYRLVLDEGKGILAVMNTLNERKVLTPSAYKAEHGDVRFARYHQKRESDKHRWCIATVAKILRDRMYVGDLVGCKSETVNYRAKKKRNLPYGKHLIVENTHEPIVSREDFERAREILKGRHRPSRHIVDNLFRSIIYCGKCGRRMVLATHEIKHLGGTKRTRSLYRCFNHFVNPAECEKFNYIYHDDVKEQVWKSVKRVLNLMQSDGSSLEAVRKRIDGKGNSDKLIAERVKIGKRLNTLTTMLRKMYEDYAAERLDEIGYQGLLAGCQAEKKTLTERVATIASELGKTGNREESIKRLKDIAAGYADSAELTAEIVHKLIERIEIYSPKNLGKDEVREINIIYRFVNANL
jgi:DNA invertase Pin-like site-specific DNA recombinase